MPVVASQHTPRCVPSPSSADEGLGDDQSTVPLVRFAAISESTYSARAFPTSGGRLASRRELSRPREVVLLPWRGEATPGEVQPALTLNGYPVAQRLGVGPTNDWGWRPPLQ